MENSWQEFTTTNASKSRVGLLLFSASILCWLCYTIALFRRREAFKREKGLLPAPWFNQNRLLLGFDTMYHRARELREHRMLESLDDEFRTAGKNTVQFNIMGRHRIITIEPENLKVMQAVDSAKWHITSLRLTHFHPFTGTGIFTSNGTDWQHSRDMLRPSFTRAQITDLDALEHHVQRLVAKIPADGHTIDLSKLFFKFTMDTATELLFGESTNSLCQEDDGEFPDAFQRSQEETFRRTLFGSAYYLVSNQRKTAETISTVHRFVDRYVANGLARRQELLEKSSDQGGGGRYVFLEELVRRTTDPVRIRSELLNIMIAGRDTTASLLTNVWGILGQRQDIWGKLQMEISGLEGKRPSFTDLKDLKYLRAILSESLRLHPVVPLNTREATEDTTLPVGGGQDGKAPMFIKKGQIVIWSTYAMHRRKDLYGEDALDFRPERWIDDPRTGRKGLRPTWEYLPFNGGARICLGQQLALTEASYLTVRLCQAFQRIEARCSSQWTESIHLTASNLHGAKVALFRRT